MSHPTVCVRCGRDIWREYYHWYDWYDGVQPEHCIYCAPATCFTCQIRRAGLPRSQYEQDCDRAGLPYVPEHIAREQGLTEPAPTGDETAEGT